MSSLLTSINLEARGGAIFFVQGTPMPTRRRNNRQSDGWRSQYVYHFCDRSQTLNGHISIIKLIHNKSYAAIDRGAAPRSKTVEFLLWIILVIEIWRLKVLDLSQK